MIRSLAVFGAALVAALSGCTTARPVVVTGSPISPIEAIIRAADSAPREVPGLFAFRVAATGRHGDRLYLNSEGDYRDQRNLTVSIEPQVIPLLRQRFGALPDAYLRGKWIEVRGAAQRVRILFTDDGRPTGKYYYQTHVRVTDPAQIVTVQSS